MAYTAENWPITAALLQFPGTDATGTHINDAEASAWADVLTEVKDAGFANADLTDSWVRPGDLSPARLAEFKQTAERRRHRHPRHLRHPPQRDRGAELGSEPGVQPPHHRRRRRARLRGRLLRAAPGAHRRAAQTALVLDRRGHKDPVGDKETWGKAVTRLRELGRHAAEVGVLLSLEMYEDTYLGHRGFLRPAGPGHRTGQRRPQPRHRQPHPAPPPDRGLARDGGQDPPVLQLLAHEELHPR